MLRLFFLVLGIHGKAQAHLMGSAPWCLSNSPVHFECFYDSEESCQKMSRMRGSSKVLGASGLEQWTCVSFPYEFSLKPQSKKPE